MDDPDTDTLRKQAPSWTLASDEQLLTILQSTHQRLLAKCQDVNGQLEQMATALNVASVSLQNVNNQFMALSSCQFIESRVYDDDELSTDVPVVKEAPKPVVLDELTSLKRSIAVLENAHEVITILRDSDTESDTDDDMTARMVLKPKDVYADRPLPHIIGSQAWKNKWHAGLVVEESESDSSEEGERAASQYSSERDDTHTDKLHAPATHTTVSETSSELPSEQALVSEPSPADVATELARRLGGREPPQVDREPEYEEPAKPAVRKIYRPQDPISSTIFPDEPPPLSDESDSPESDIFAELHRSQPYARAQAADDLFGFTEDDHDEGDIFSDFATKPVTDPSAKPQSLFEAGPTPHMFDKRPDNDRRPATASVQEKQPVHSVSPEQQRVNEEQRIDAETDRGVKKPIGGISLFGKKGTESIGAAILKRNQRKSSASDDASESDSRSETQTQPQRSKEKDIFDDLFARSEGKKIPKEKVDVTKDIKAAIERKKEEKDKDKKPTEKSKVDLFSDNLFDDIDDIFSTDVVKMPSKNETKAKSLFEDDDDLFSEIAAPKPMKIEVASSSNIKNSLFDSDDELFSENISKPKTEKPKMSEKAPVKVSESINKVIEPSRNNKEVTKRIFDDDEDDIFSDVKISNKLNEAIKVQNTPISNEIHKDVSKDKAQTSKTSDFNAPETSASNFKSPSLFDDDDDESDLFAEPAKSSKVSIITTHLEKPSIIKEMNISEENHNTPVISPSSSIKTEKQGLVKNDNFNINKEIKNIECSVNKTVDQNVSNNNSEDLKNIPISENVDRRKSNTVENTETNATKIFEHIGKSIQKADSSFDTNDDLSDQDFDDLPPEIEETNKTVNNNAEIVTIEKTEAHTDNIFADNTLQGDIFAQAIDDKLNTGNSNTIFKTQASDFTENVPNKTENDNKTNVIATKNVEVDIFTNIISEPPDFEKPKEPKRSKNVNALFDDDSDDESLFFKKNDTTFDDNPDDFAAKQDRFGIFTDEPPDDFSKINDDDDMFCTLPTPKLPHNENSIPIPNTDRNIDKTSVPQNDNNIHDFDELDPVEDLFSTIPKDKTEMAPEASNIPVIDTSKESIKSINQMKPVTVETVEQPQTIPSDDELFKTPAKESKPSITKRLLDVSDDEILFSSVPKLEKPVLLSKDSTAELNSKSQESVNKPSDDELFTSLSTDKPLPFASKTIKQDLESRSDEDLFKIPKSKPQLVSKPENTGEPRTESKLEPKKVGKLKVGLNINVNALLPGASPKKVKPNDQHDGQAQSVAPNPKQDLKISPDNQKSETELSESQNTDSTLKSVSFDGEPESGVLDNKLSKERPRIQVKRRPSTRKARREAVRKSIIDFGEDSTDNSSSIDDPPRNSKKADLDDDRNTEHNTQPEGAEESKVQTNPENTIKPEIQHSKVEKETQPVTGDTQAEIPDKTFYQRDVKSKIVYILNDEDIFNTSPAEKLENKTEVSLISENIDSSVGVSTLGKVYDQTDATKHPKTPLFNDENDEDIFKGKSDVKKTSLFDSDSDAELFGTSKSEVEKIEKKEVKKEVVKRSLFGDEDDDDDLFGIKTKKSVEQKPQTSRSTVKETTKQAEPVFEDPLSMFDDDE